MTLLHEDFQHRLSNWSDNPAATDAQKKQWPGNIPHRALGYDHKNRLILEEDGQPVGSVKANTARCYWSNNENHRWPPIVDVVRFARFFHLKFVPKLALVLKSQWEPFFAKESRWEFWADNLFDALRNEEKARECTRRFQPGEHGSLDADALYDLFEEQGQYASQAGYDRDHFKTLINQAILAKCHRLGNPSLELDEFVKVQEGERALLKQASKEQEQEFLRRKLMWVEVRNTLGNWQWEIETQRLKNAKIEQQWLTCFGEVYVPMMEAYYQVLSLERRIAIKEQFGPELTYEELETREAEARETERKKLEEFRILIEIGGSDDSDVTYVSGDEAVDYLSECKRVLFKIHSLSHPDHTDLEGRFTDEQRRQLRDYFEQAKAVRPSELRSDQSHRVLGDLINILADVKAVWETMGIDIDARLVIRGETLDEQLDWLEEEIVRLEREIDEVRSDYVVLSDDKEILENAATLASAAQVEETTRQMEQKRKDYEAQIDGLDKQLDALFGEEAA